MIEYIQYPERVMLRKRCLGVLGENLDLNERYTLQRKLSAIRVTRADGHEPA